MPAPSLLQRKLNEDAYKPRPWPLMALYVTFFGNFGLSVMEASRMPPSWSRLGVFSACVSLVFLGRVLLARTRKDTGPGWIIWALLLGASGIWTLIAGAFVA